MTAGDPIALGSRRELFVDDYLVERFSGGAALRLHSPVAREVVLVADRPWEGNQCFAYATVFRDGGLCRLYYQAWHWTQGHEHRGLAHAYAESQDGLAWRRPDLGLVEHEGSRANNLIWKGAGPEGKGIHGFAAFKDSNPACRPEARYKAVGAREKNCPGGLFAAVSPDGLRWSLLREEPIITAGKFDSQNLAFWDLVRRQYRAYVRDFKEGRRCIRTCTSEDFVNWTDPQWLDYPGAPPEQLYTNQVAPYGRAPHIFVGFPTRYVDRGEWSPTVEAMPEVEHRRLRSATNRRYGTAVTEALFMTSRDGRTFRRWGEAFLRPGPQLEGNWAYGDNYLSWGMIETPSSVTGAPPELSLYGSENYWRGVASRLRRYTIRTDGFVSVHAPLVGGEVLTKPLTFHGGRLELNVATSAAGDVRVEFQDGDGRPIEGFALADAWEVVADRLDYVVQWKAGPDLGRLAGRTVRLRFVLRDADLYSFRFRNG